MSLFSDPSWKKAFIWALLTHVVFLLIPTILTQYWPLRPNTPKIVTIDLFNVAPTTNPNKKKISNVKLQKQIIKESPKKTLSKIKKTKKKTSSIPIRKVKHKDNYYKLNKSKKAKNLVSIHPKKLKRVKKNSKIDKKKLAYHKKKNYKYKKQTKNIKKKKQENFDRIISEKIKQIQKQIEEKKREQYLAKQLKQLEEIVQQKAKQRYNQALRNYLARYVYPELHRNWAWPEGLSKEPLQCIIVIDIDEHGNIIKKWIEKSSGNQLFDQSALRAVEESGPFPPLPVPLRPGPLEIGVRFKPNQIGK